IHPECSRRQEREVRPHTREITSDGLAGRRRPEPDSSAESGEVPGGVGGEQINIITVHRTQRKGWWSPVQFRVIELCLVDDEACAGRDEGAGRNAGAFRIRALVAQLKSGG